MWSTQRRPPLPPLLFLAVQIAILLLFSSTSCLSATADSTKIQEGQEHKPVRLLLLGKSGAGKTAFLDLLLWYAEASLLPNPSQASVDTIRLRHSNDNENSENRFKSQTKAVTSYKLQMGNGVWFEILDTPGFNDNRGKNQDQENSDLIVESLRGVDYINAMLLVSQGQETRKTSSLKTVLEGLQSFLPDTLSESTMCIFTSCPDKNDLIFPLRVLKDDLGLNPPTPQFLLENPFAKIGSNFVKSDHETLKAVRDNAVELIPRLDSLFEELSKFVSIPMTVLDTMEINRDYKKNPMRIVLAGTTGSGKTTFGELLRFHLNTSHTANPGEASAEFLRDLKLKSSSRSDTKKVTKHSVKLSGGGLVDIFDTPGLLDSPSQDSKHVIEIGNLLKTLDYVDAILIILNGKESPNDDDMKYLLAQFSAVFHPDLYSSIAMVFSHIDNDSDRRPDSRISYDFASSELGFSSEIVKDRSFYVDNPLHLLASEFDLKKTGQTIQSLWQRSKMIKKCCQRGGEEVSRLMKYFTSSSVKRCSNPTCDSMIFPVSLSE